MQTFVDGKLNGTFGAKGAPAVRAKDRKPLALEGVALDPEAAARGVLWSWRSLSGGFGFAGMMLVVLAIVGPFFAGETGSAARTAAISALLVVIGAALVALQFRAVRRRWAGEIAARAAAAPAAGTRIRLDEQGVSVGDLAAPWSQIEVERIDLNYDGGGEGDPFYRVERLSLVAGGERVTLDRDLLSDGQAIVDAGYQRLVAQRARLAAASKTQSRS